MLRKTLALVFAYLFLALAVIGIFLPVVPTVPFLLLSAWFAARGSPRLHKWLYDHPKFGSILINWEEQRAISRSSKIIATLMLIASGTFLYIKFGVTPWLIAALILFICVSIFMWTRNEPK